MVRVEQSASPHQRLPGAQLLWRQELALLTPLKCVVYGLCCGLYGYCSLLRTIRLQRQTQDVRRVWMSINQSRKQKTAQC